MASRVLVVDDSVIYRRHISKIVRETPGLELVGEAGNGREALQLFSAKPADIVTLDVEMPLMTGLQVLPELLKIKPEVRIIMISSLTSSGATTTLEALRLGAVDFIAKDQAFGMDERQGEALKRTLSEMLVALSSARSATTSASVTRAGEAPSQPRPSAPAQPPVQYPPAPVDILLVGCSTGGPQALLQFFSAMKPGRRYATVVVQHMPPLFTAQLATNITRSTGRSCVEAENGMPVKRDTIFIAPGGRHLELEKKEGAWFCRLSDAAPVNFCRPAVDVLFHSAARALSAREAVAVVMTGIGNDGAGGCKALFTRRIPILTQNRETCVVYGMPKAVDDLGISAVHAAPQFLVGEAEKFMLQPQA